MTIDKLRKHRTARQKLEWDNKWRFYKGGKCVVCYAPITVKNKSGYCREHNPHSKNRTIEYRKRMSDMRWNEQNPNWKGDGVQKNGLHRWVFRHKPKPELCECCQTRKPNDLANVSGSYKRDVSDFEWLCRHCHMLKDGRLNNLKQYAN